VDGGEGSEGSPCPKREKIQPLRKGCHRLCKKKQFGRKKYWVAVGGKEGFLWGVIADSYRGAINQEEGERKSYRKKNKKGAMDKGSKVIFFFWGEDLVTKQRGGTRSIIVKKKGKKGEGKKSSFRSNGGGVGFTQAERPFTFFAEKSEHSC